MDKLLESFVCLIKKLDILEANKANCNILSRKLRAIACSDNLKKKGVYGEMINQVIEPLYKKNREDIMCKDFSFLTDSNFVYDEVNVGQLYLNVIDSDDSDGLDKITNELLYLFFLIATDEDKDEMDKKYKKSKPVSQMPDMAQLAQGVKPIGTGLQGILQKHASKLKGAEKDSSKIGKVLSDIFKSDSEAMVGMVQGVLGNMGMDGLSSNK